MRTGGNKPRRSGFEENFGNTLVALGIPHTYEARKVKYNVVHIYTPDWELPSGLIIETKGWLQDKDRSILAHVKEQHPELDIRVLFQKKAEAFRPIYKGSPTTKGEWLDAHGIPWAAEKIPRRWLIEGLSACPANMAGVSLPEGNGDIPIIVPERPRQPPGSRFRGRKAL